MSWILIGVIFTLVHTNHHRTTVDRLIGQQAFGVAATPIPPNGKYNARYAFVVFRFCSRIISPSARVSARVRAEFQLEPYESPCVDARKVRTEPQLYMVLRNFVAFFRRAARG